MIRAISIVLILAIALQTVGCSSWRPLTSANKVAENKRHQLIRDEAFGKLMEGMRVKMRIREGTGVLIDRQVFKCVIKGVGLTSLTVMPVTPLTPFMSSVRIRARKRITLKYSDIVSIEYDSDRGRGLTVFLVGVGVGTILGFLGFAFHFARSGD